MRSNSIQWVLVLGASLFVTLPAAADAKFKTYLCLGTTATYELQMGEINEGSVALRVCAGKELSCETQISMDEDTDEESTGRRFFGVDHGGREYYLEFWETQDKGRADEYWLTVELEGVILDHLVPCRLQ